MTEFCTKVDQRSGEQGFFVSRLPVFTEEESAEIAKSADFIGVNSYTSLMAYPTPPHLIDTSLVGYDYDMDVTTYKDHRWYK